MNATKKIDTISKYLNAMKSVKFHVENNMKITANDLAETHKISNVTIIAMKNLGYISVNPTSKLPQTWRVGEPQPFMAKKVLEYVNKYYRERAHELKERKQTKAKPEKAPVVKPVATKKPKAKKVVNKPVSKTRKTVTNTHQTVTKKYKLFGITIWKTTTTI
jgi:hypothetical protein